jgi:hypothetical protein
MPNGTTTVPPLAEPLSGTGAAHPPRLMREGCWLINVTPPGTAPASYDGTMRIDRDAAGCTASGDLYKRPVFTTGNPPRAVLGAAPSPAAGIPSFAIDKYSQYLRVRTLDDRSSTAGVQLGFEAWQYDRAIGWTNRGILTANLLWKLAPAQFPASMDYLEGDIVRANGQAAGRLKLGWIAPRLRKVTVEIDSAAGCEQPADNGAGFGWQQLFSLLKWEGLVQFSNNNVAEPAGGNWSDAALHAAMLLRRDRSDLNAEWRYHMLSVRRTLSSERGVMYDNAGSDANNVPREGCALAAFWPIPDIAQWGQTRGQRFGASAACFFRAAVHELGHAFGLDHETEDLGFMNTTEMIAAGGTAAKPFPTNVRWAFSPRDTKRLRHWPDILVRPGGARSGFGFAGDAPPVLGDAQQVEPEGLTLAVTPLLGEVPIGAPVRVNIALANQGRKAARVPARLSLKTEYVRGRVIDPSGVARGFSTLMRCIEDHTMRDLRPGESLADDLTLLRGADGPLFPTPGLYTIVVEIIWPIRRARMMVSSETTLFVTNAEGRSHAAAAHRILAVPDVHLVLVIGGEHLTDGVDAIAEALNDDILRPHFAAIEARRLIGLPGGRESKARQLCSDAVMSASEGVKLEQLLSAPKSRKKTRSIAKDGPRLS